MKTLQKWLDLLNERFFSSTYQVQRIVILAAIVLVLGAVSFGAYYYFDRYYVKEAPIAQQSLSAAEQAVRDDPQNIDKRLALAQAYMIASRWNDAIPQALQVQVANPDDLRVDFVLGISYSNSGKPQDAIEPLQKYIDSKKDESMLGLNKQYLSALYFLGDSYLQLGEPEKAIDPLAQVAVLAKTDADSFYKLGLAYNGASRYEEAITVFNRAIAFVPDYAEAYLNMAGSYEALGKKSEANYALGMVAYSQKDYAKAYTMLVQTAQELPGFAPVFTGLGQTCEAQLNLQCALDSYKAAAQLDPADFTASRGVERIQAQMKK